ncbi:MAG: hypothetical protein KBD56_01990 [Candidatus Eisenbacteria bacterium]|nr:hypothetical protein [Candidatus Eisenbacteria bacterium]
MMRAGFGRRMTAFVGAGTALLLIGLIFDLALTRPRIHELRRLEAERGENLKRQTEHMAVERQERELIGLAREQGLEETLFRPAAQDPLTYVGGLIERSGIRRLALNDGGSQAIEQVVRTKLTLRVAGAFGPTLSFVRALEQSPRLIVIQDFDIEPSIEGPGLESRLTIFVHDPKPEAAT